MINLRDIYNVKGVNYIFKPKIYLWQYIENEFKNLISKYCYDEIKLPLIERTFLFTRTLGSNSDIIRKEMFSFKDNKNRSFTLLPEGTTSCLKSLIFDGYLRNFQKQNIWYISPMFRKENTQKGRSRLFHQIGVESFGEKCFTVDFEHIIIINKFFKNLNIGNLILEVNFIDNKKRSKYKSILKSYILNNNLFNFNNNLFNFNPLLFLDKLDKKFLGKIPSLLNYLNGQKKIDFIKMLYFLKIKNIFFVINKCLVRGLDYYDGLVYEWTSNIDNKYLAVCAGGRYNNLSGYFNNSIYGTGCALGIERIFLIINNNFKKKNFFFFLFEKNISFFDIFFFLEYMRNKFNINILFDSIVSSFEQKLKKIRKRGINYIFFIEKEKIKENKIIFITNGSYKVINTTKLSRYIWKKKVILW